MGAPGGPLRATGLLYPAQPRARRLGLRARISDDRTAFIVEVADEGIGAGGPLIGDLFEVEGNGRLHVGLAMTKSIVEQHGGGPEIHSEPAERTYVQAVLPLRE